MFLEDLSEAIKKIFDLNTPKLSSFIINTLKSDVTSLNFTVLDAKIKKVDKYIAGIEKVLVNEIVKATTKELASLSEAMGIEIPRLKFISELKGSIHNLMSTLPLNIRSSVSEYLTLNAIKVTDKQLMVDLAIKIEKTVKQTQILVQEVSVVTSRNFINNQYKNFEKDYEVIYEYVGPVDKNISKICSMYVGQRHTRAVWESIKPDFFINGGHFGCRHSFVIVGYKRRKKK